MLVKRRFVNGGKEVDRLLDDAATAGTDLIEVLFSRFSDAEHKIAGYEVPVIKMQAAGSASVYIDSSVSWIEGVTVFYPDDRRQCWGYIFDTPKNREKLEKSLATGWFQISDKKIREDIISKASENGLETEHTESVVLIKKTKRERELESQTKNLAEQLEELRRKTALAEQRYKELADEKGVRVSKRLTGVKIPDRDLATSNIEELKNVGKHAGNVS